MSGKYSRAYGRKKTAPPLSQFDRLLSDCSGSSTKPSANKTGCHIGKWGTSSFTSIRAINGSVGKEEHIKHSYSEDSPPLTQGDEYYCDPTSNGSAVKLTLTCSKPRKFFKSRVAEVPRPISPEVQQPAARVFRQSFIKAKPAVVTLPVPFETPTSSQDSSVAEKESIGHESKSMSGGSDRSVSKCGNSIKLKIFKSRNTTTDVYSSAVELPSDDSRANSCSTSITSSPSTIEDCGEELNEVGNAVNPCKELRSGSLSTGKKIDSIVNKLLPMSSEIKKYQENICPGNSFLSNSSTESNSYGKIHSKSPVHESSLFKDAVVSKKGLSTRERSHGGRPKKIRESMPLVKVPLIEAKSEPVKVKHEHLILKNECRGQSQTIFDSGQTTCSGLLTGTKLRKHEDSIAPIFQSVPSGTPAAKCEVLDKPDLSSGIKFLFSDCTTSEPSPRKRRDKKCQNSGILPSLPENNTQEMEWDSTTTMSLNTTDAQRVNSPEPQLVKKRSFFKSRDVTNEAKKRATYRHQWNSQEEAKKSLGTPTSSGSQNATTVSSYDDLDFDSPETMLKRIHTWPGATNSLNFPDDSESSSVTSVKCSRGAKQFYTVIKNVKKTHQLQESGEFQEFNDDVEYFLDALHESAPVSTRCLAALNLAQKCMVPSFRMHLRAHGTVIKFFSSLSNAPADNKLAICTSVVMFTLSQDHLNMDLDRNSLELMLNLLDCDAGDAHEGDAGVASDMILTEKIREQCREVQKKGHAKHLSLDNITAGYLAMETLLSLTSKRAGEWFKEELRDLGGVDHLVRTITRCTDSFQTEVIDWTQRLLETLSKVDRCLKVLENVTNQNDTNQEHLLKCDDGKFADVLVNLFRLCHHDMQLYPISEAASQVVLQGMCTGQRLVVTMITTMKVLVNLTHNSQQEALGSQMLGSNQKVYDLALNCLLVTPQLLPRDFRFEVIILSCCLLLNLVEHSKKNRITLMQTVAPELDSDDDMEIFIVQKPVKKAMQALVELFYRCEKSAQEQEAHTDQIITQDLDRSKEKDKDKKEDEIEETVAKLLQKAGHHMEDTLIAAYVALLTGYCIMDDENCQSEIRTLLPDANFKVMVVVLKKFLRFMSLTATTSLLRSLKPTERVVKFMEKLDTVVVVETIEEKLKMEAKEMELEAFGF